MNSPVFFELQAVNPEQLANFYEKVFGWTFDKQEGLPVEYWRITTQGIAGGLLKQTASAPPDQTGTNAAVISMEVRDYESAEKTILDNGGRVALPKFAVPGRCWQGYYIDTGGNTFGIFEVDESAK